MKIINTIQVLILSNVVLAFREIYKTKEKKMILNDRNYKRLAKSMPRLGKALLWTEDVQTENPYNSWLIFHCISWAGWVSWFFLFSIFFFYIYIFEPYNDIVLDWFIEFWPKKMIEIYGKWLLNKNDFLKNRASILVILQMLIPMTLINFFYLVFDYMCRNKLRYRKWFFKFVFLIFIIILVAFFF